MGADWWKERPLVAGLAVTLSLAAGLMSAASLEVLAESERTGLWVDVVLSVPGLSAEAVDEEVAGRVEELVRSVRGTRSLTSVSSPGWFSVRVGCERGEDVGQIRSEIVGRVARYCEAGGLPAASVNIGVSGQRYAHEHTLRIGVWSNNDRASPGSAVRGILVPALLAIQEIATLEIEGEARQGVSITPRTGVILRYTLTSAEIAAVVGDWLEAADDRAAGDPGSPVHAMRGDLGELPVQLVGNRRVLELDDCACLETLSAAPEVTWRIQGCPAVVIAVRRKPGTDLPGLARKVKTAMDAEEHLLPPGLEWTMLDDPAMRRRADISCTMWTILAGLLCSAAAAGWHAGSLRVAAGTLTVTLCTVSGGLAAMAIAGKPLGPASFAGFVLGWALLLPWIRVLSGSLPPGDPLRTLRHILPGVAAGGALIVVSRFLPPGDISADLSDAGLTAAVLSACGILGIPAAAITRRLTTSRRSPGRLFLVHAMVVNWCRQRRRTLAALWLAVMGIPLWLVPRDLSPAHPLFRLHLITFGSPIYREYRPLVEQLLGGIVFAAVRHGLRGEPEPDQRNTVVMAALELPAGSGADDALSVSKAMEREALAIVKGEAVVISQIAPGSASVTAQFRMWRSDRSIPYRLTNAFRQVATGLGNTRVLVLGSGPGFHSGQSPEPTVSVELRGYEREETERVALDLRRFLEADVRVHDVQISGTTARQEVLVEIAPAGWKELPVTSVARRVLAHTSRSWVARPNGQPLVVRLSGTFGDTAETLPSIRRTGEAARSLRDLLLINRRDVASSVVREQREYVRHISCMIDGPADMAEDLVAILCRRFSLPPGCSLTVGGVDGSRGSAEVEAMVWACLMALMAFVLAVAALDNSLRSGVAVCCAQPSACIGIAFAMVLAPLPAGAWVVCSLGIIMALCAAAGVAVLRKGGGEVCGTWLMVVAALLPLVLVPAAADVRPAFHADGLALWSGVGVTIGLLLTSLTNRVLLPTIE